MRVPAYLCMQDVIKVRLQLARSKAGEGVRPPGMVGAKERAADQQCVQTTILGA